MKEKKYNCNYHMFNSLFPDQIDLNNSFFNSQLITYIGNKRALLGFINRGITRIKEKLGKKKLTTFDGFSGSGVVARLLKYHSEELWVNDLEKYSEVINKCYLVNKSEINLDYIISKINWLNENKLDITKKPGFIEKNYAPRDDNNIELNERVFYTNKNAKILDNLKMLIYTKIPQKYQHFFLAPLIVEASIHTNTSGVFKGFHKKDGIGHFGGRGENALSRIKADINLDIPIFSDVECKIVIKREDINKLVKESKLPYFDVVYYDPPYNQHPYGSNYFMLNILCDKKNIEIQNGVSGIAKNWNKSNYNKRKEAEEAMDQLIKNTHSKYILLSYNNEGIIPLERLKKILINNGKIEHLIQEYNTYRGSRNLRNRNIKVNESLWVLEKKN